MGEGRKTAVVRYVPVGYSEVDGMGRRKGYEMKTADAFGSDLSAHRPLTGSAENSIPCKSVTVRNVLSCIYEVRGTRDEAVNNLIIPFQRQSHRLVIHRERQCPIRPLSTCNQCILR